MAGVVGETLGAGQQRLPLRIGQSTALPVGAGILAAVVEEADVVVPVFQGFDRLFDELVEFAQVVGEIFGDVEVHAVVSVG